MNTTQPSQISKPARNDWARTQPLSIDIVTGLILAAASAAAAWAITGLQDHFVLLINVKADDVWFEGDAARVFSNMTNRWSDHYKSNVHPLFSLFSLVFGYLCESLLHIKKLDVVRFTIATGAAVWMGLYYTLLRLLGCRRADSVLFGLVAATSAAAIFWTATPETYLFGSATILLALATAAAAERYAIPAWLDVGVAAATLSITVTNWMVALASLMTRHRLKQAVQLAVNSFVVVVLLMGVQKLIAPSARFIYDVKSETKALIRPEPLTTLKVMALDTMVMPNIAAEPQEVPTLWPQFTIQRAYAWNFTAWGPIALAAWLALLACGAWAVVTLKSLKKFRLVLLLSLAGQLALHAVYGSESFLYALNWLPLLITMCALATLTRLRWIALSLAAVLTVAGAMHNYASLRFALDALAKAAAANP